MGNLCTCLSYQDAVNTRQQQNNNPKRLYSRSSSAPAAAGTTSNRWSRIRSSRRENNNNFKFEDPVMHQQALAAAAIILRQQQQNSNSNSKSSNNGSLVPSFDRSNSLSNKSKQGVNNRLPRCCSSRPRLSTDPLLQPHRLLTQDETLDGLETKSFVLVHGGGFGAWCWYKTIALLDESGYTVTAIDLTGSGIHSSDTNGITSLAQYVKPLTDFLDKLSDGEKVILVGHDFGGTCIAYAMELFSSKVSKAIFVAATMLTNGQSAFEIFSQQVETKDLMQKTQTFVYANGNHNPPTAIDLNKSLLKELLFNQSPQKDVALASVSMRSIPFAPVLEKLSLSDGKYGSVRRFYIETAEDSAIPITSQQQMIKAAPPEQVFRLKGADHSPFFSKPQALHKILVEISKVP